MGRQYRLTIMLAVMIALASLTPTISQKAQLSTKNLEANVSASNLRPLLAAFTWQPCYLCEVPGNVVFFEANWSSPQPLITNYVWNFGDGSPVVNTTSPNVSHLFYSAYKSTVTLTVADVIGRTDTVSHPVLFDAVPRFTYQPVRARVGRDVLFNASASFVLGGAIIDFNWDFGDGSTGTGKIVVHSYSNPGTFRVILTLVTTEGEAAVSKALPVWLRGDVNGDCIVSLLDAVTAAKAYGTKSTEPGFNSDADLNGDNVVNIFDTAIIGADYGATCSSS